MAFFTKYTWKDREGTNLNRRKFTNVDTSEETTCDVSRAEGINYQEPLEFTADAMNDIEDRIASAFDSLDSLMDSSLFLEAFYPVGCLYLSYNNTNPHDTLGGTWAEVTGGLLLPSDNLPEDMTTSNRQYEGADTETISCGGTVTFASSSGYVDVGYADLPSHRHSLVEYRTQTQVSTESFDGHSGSKPLVDDSRYYYNIKTSGTSLPLDGNNNGNSSYGGHTHPFSGRGSLASTPTVSIDKRKPGVNIRAWVRTA